VFYFDSGEQNVHPLVPYFLAEAAGPSAVMALAQRFNDLAVLFEHRFYDDPHEGKVTWCLHGGHLLALHVNRNVLKEHMPICLCLVSLGLPRSSKYLEARVL
jgi:hypothetical protein